MEMNVNVYRATGKLATVRRFEFSEGSPCTLPDGSFILHSQSFEDDRGDYIELWVSVPKDSNPVSKSVNILGESIPASDAARIIEEEDDENFDDDVSFVGEYDEHEGY